MPTTPRQSPLIQLYEFDEDGSSPVADFDTLEEGFDDLMHRIRFSIDGREGGVGWACLAEAEEGTAYVNVLCDLNEDNRDKSITPGRCKLVGGVQQEFGSLDDALTESARLLRHSLAEAKPLLISLELPASTSEICSVMMETFQGEPVNERGELANEKELIEMLIDLDNRSG